MRWEILIDIGEIFVTALVEAIPALGVAVIMLSLGWILKQRLTVRDNEMLLHGGVLTTRNISPSNPWL
jgi:hypothetical protein